MNNNETHNDNPKTLHNPDAACQHKLPRSNNRTGAVIIPERSRGSLLYDSGGNLTGSALIGQPFSDGCTQNMEYKLKWIL